jgi:hypothetical protein
LTTKVSAALAAVPQSGPLPDWLRASASALADALRVLVVFRGKHITYARRTYPPEYQDQAGSGGGTIALLQDILDLTRENANLVRR